jgi:hypothetical protein
MSLRIYAFAVTLSLSFLAAAQSKREISCPAMPTEVNRDIRNNFEASLGRILGLKAAELRNETSIVARQLLARVPNADRVYVAQMMASVFCQNLANSNHVSQVEKLDRISEFTNRIAILVTSQLNQDPPTARLLGTTDTPSPRQSPQNPRRANLTPPSAVEKSENIGTALLACEERSQRYSRDAQSSLDLLLDEKKNAVQARDDFAKEKLKLTEDLSSCKALSQIVVQNIAQDKMSREWQSSPPKIFVDQQSLLPDCVKKSTLAFQTLKFEGVTARDNTVSAIQGPYQLYMLCYEPRQMLIVSGPDLDVAGKITAMVRGSR